MSFWLAERSFDLTTNSRNGLDTGPFEFGNLDGRVEHVLDKRRVAEDLVRISRQFQLFHNFGRFVHVQDDSRGRYPKASVGVGKRLHTAEASIGRDKRSIERAKAMHVLRSVLEHSIS